MVSSSSIIQILLVSSSLVVSAANPCGYSLSNDFLSRLKQDGINTGREQFIPSVYYNQEATKVISIFGEDTIDDSWLCVDGADEYSGPIQLYDDGTNGDDKASDGIFTRDCVHFCKNIVDFSDMYGFAMQKDFDGSNLVVLDPSKRGTVPYNVLDTPLTPGAKAIASSHAFFFADPDGKYYPNYPKNTQPNGLAGPDAKSVVVAALLQVFGDVFDYVTVTPLEGRNDVINGAGIYKWQNWDRRAGPMIDQPIGDIDTCALSLTGVPTYRLAGVINTGDIVSGDGFAGQIHELIHGVSGYSYNMKLDEQMGNARVGDNMHVAGACTMDHSYLQGPVWDWVKGFPDSVPGSTGEWGSGVRLEANEDCSSCPDDNLASCCSFRYEDMPKKKSALLAKPDLTIMSPLMLYIAGIMTAAEVPADKKTYYCIGSDTDGGCGENSGKPCLNTVDDSDRSKVTSNYVKRFTFDQLKLANGGHRFPKKKFKVVRHATMYISAREPSEAEITFHTLIWRQHEIQDLPWERIGNRDAISSWKFVTSGRSILHSRLHGIECGENSASIPSCNDSGRDVCSDAPCGPGAVCKSFDGQPLCLCMEGLVGDGMECAYPSETGYGRAATAHELSNANSPLQDCFAEGNLWPSFTDESSLPPYPGGKVPYAATTCNNSDVCPVGWRCLRNKGCKRASSKGMCEGNGLNKGKCLALGCCKFIGGECKKWDKFRCPKQDDFLDGGIQCDNPDTCCYFSCDALHLGREGTEIGQKGNCGKDCTAGIEPDLNGVIHPDLFLWEDIYITNHEQYGYGTGPLVISGSDKNMFNRCMNQCFSSGGGDEDDLVTRFLLRVKGKDDSLVRKRCPWLQRQNAKKKRKICRRNNLSTRGFKPASEVCKATCAPYLS